MIREIARGGCWSAVLIVGWIGAMKITQGYPILIVPALLAIHYLIVRVWQEEAR